MPKKEDTKKGSAKPVKSDGDSKGGKAKKKKWTKGKVRDKLNNMVLFDKATYDKMLKEVPAYKLITPSVISERMKIRVSLAKQALEEMGKAGTIRLVSKHHSQVIYTRSTKAGDEKGADDKGADDKAGAAQKGEKAAGGKKVGGGVSKRKADAEKTTDATA